MRWLWRNILDLFGLPLLLVGAIFRGCGPKFWKFLEVTMIAAVFAIPFTPALWELRIISGTACIWIIGGCIGYAILAFIPQLLVCWVMSLEAEMESEYVNTK